MVDENPYEPPRENSPGLGMTAENVAAVLSLLYLLGVVVIWFAPETKGQELPE